jgi:serine/threonine-protein kinase RsbW
MGERQEAMHGRIILELPSDPRTVSLSRRVLRSLLEDLAVDESRRDDIELAVSEAAGNVVRHAYDHPAHPYRVRLDIFADQVRLVVVDQGVGFNRADVPEPDLEELGGRGLWLIERIADVTTLCTLPGGGCRLEAEFHLPQPVALPSMGETVPPPPAWSPREAPSGVGGPSAGKARD